MKKTFQIMVSTSAASLLAFAALAEHTPNHKSARSDYNQQRLNGSAKASDIIGMTVNNYQGEKIGKVEDLALDVQSGKVVQVILSTGGYVGRDDALTAVPPSALHHDVAQKVLHLNADKTKLKAAPQFDNARWDESTESNRLNDVYAYYGEKTDFASTPDGAELTSIELERAKNLPRNMDGTINTDGSKTVDKIRNQELADKLANHYSSKSTSNADGTWKREFYPNRSGINSSGSSLGNIQKASTLIGKPVENLQDEKLGDVNNILVDLASGRIVAVIVSSGGFLGMGDELSAIPPTALRFASDSESLQLDTTKEALSNATHFKSNQWPDFNQPSYVSEVYRAYQVEPYFTNEATTEANNTRRNVRDRDDQALTPLNQGNQGNSKPDEATTAKIRTEIAAESSMSVNARNVKIITDQGRVTLRGPVNTAEEKRLIGEIAERIARSGNVDNQLEVKFTPTGN